MTQGPGRATLINQHPAKAKTDAGILRRIYRHIAGAIAIKVKRWCACKQDGIGPKQLLQLVGHYECPEMLKPEIKEEVQLRVIAYISSILIVKPIQ